MRSSERIERLFRPVDGASSAAFRVLFGVLMAASLFRFWAKGWIDELYLQPGFMFPYWGFEFVEPLPGPWMYGLVGLLIVTCILVAAGVLYRPAIVVFFVGFTYLELLDATNYLNHYYFISIVAGLMCLMPLGRRRVASVPIWVPTTLRLQLALVYVFAGLAKLEPDWLLHAQPLRIWLQARAEIAVVGPWLGKDWVAHLMSWGGFLFDLTIPAWLLWKRSRPFAYLAVVGFHSATGLLFNIGMFPWVMIAVTPIFFDYDWPRRLLRRETPEPTGTRPPRWAQHAIVGVLAAHFTVQLVLPLRHLAYGGDDRWHDQGFRFAWNVMLVEKTGMVEYRVTDPDTGKRWRFSPNEELNDQQTKMMSMQPDMILQYAHHLRDRMAADGYPNVEVRVDAWASLNGRRSQRLIDPNVDLAREPNNLTPKPWIVPLDPNIPVR